MDPSIRFFFLSKPIFLLWGGGVIHIIKGGLFLTSPSVAFHYKGRETLLAGVDTLFDAIRQGFVRPAIGARYSLEDIVRMHRDAQARCLTGATLIVP
jgi:hypothetical protein